MRKNNFYKRAVWGLLLIVAATFMTTNVAFAQDEALPEAGEAMDSAGGSDNVVYKKESVYDFEADDVEGTIVRPDEANISGEQHGKTSSLIQIRTDFIPELIRSVERI